MIDVSLKKEIQTKNVDIEKPATLEEEVEELKSKLDAVSKMLFLIRKENANLTKEALLSKSKSLGSTINKEGIPNNTFYIGYTDTSKYPYILIVNDKGLYQIGDMIFKTISDAATYVCKKPTDGFNFWQTMEGIAIKDIF